MLVLGVCRLEGLALHDQFEEEAAGREDVDRIRVILSLGEVRHQFWRVAFQRPYPVGVVVGNGVGLFVDGVPRAAEVHQFHVEPGIEEDVFRFDIAVGDSAGVHGGDCGEKLSEDGPGGPFRELLGEVDDAEELAVFLDAHHVVEDAFEAAVAGAVEAAHVEIDDLDHVRVPGLARQLDLVEEELDHLVVGGAVGLGVVEPVVHDLDRHALVRGQSDPQLHPALSRAYFENRPKPSRNRTRYLSSMTGQRSRYSLGSSRVQVIDNKFGINCYNLVGRPITYSPHAQSDNILRRRGER